MWFSLINKIIYITFQQVLSVEITYVKAASSAKTTASGVHLLVIYRYVVFL